MIEKSVKIQKTECLQTIALGASKPQLLCLGDEGSPGKILEDDLWLSYIRLRGFLLLLGTDACNTGSKDPSCG